MGTNKNKQIEHVDLLAEAKSILEQIEEIKVCPCGDYYYRMYKYDDNKVCELAKKIYTKQNSTNENIQEFEQCIKEILNTYAEDSTCPHCGNKL